MKTRLAATIGADAAASVYAAFLADLAAVHAEAVLYVAEPGFPVELAGGLPIRVQHGPDLGARMARAFEDGVEVLIGSDLPTVSQEDITAARTLLRDHDLVLGPAEDGGYWLIAMSRPLDVLGGIAWSTSDVLDQTLARADQLGLRVALLDTRFDVDTVDELRRLARLPDLPPHTAAVVAAWG